jgi:hypothetical protein
MIENDEYFENDEEDRKDQLHFASTDKQSSSRKVKKKD